MTAETAGQRVHVPKMAEVIVERLRRQIVRGELTEGEALPSEHELQARFGVSRPTLREAFRILESESLITVRRGAHGGALVRVRDNGSGLKPDHRLGLGLTGMRERILALGGSLTVASAVSTLVRNSTPCVGLTPLTVLLMPSAQWPVVTGGLEP